MSVRQGDRGLQRRQINLKKPRWDLKMGALAILSSTQGDLGMLDLDPGKDQGLGWGSVHRSPHSTPVKTGSQSLSVFDCLVLVGGGFVYGAKSIGWGLSEMDDGRSTCPKRTFLATFPPCSLQWEPNKVMA